MKSIFGTTPDYRRLETVLSGGVPDRTPVYEFFSDTGVQTAAAGGWSPSVPLTEGRDPDYDAHIAAQFALGYDYLSPWAGFNFNAQTFRKTVDSSGKQRSFLDDSAALIKDREDFERFAWPTPDSVDFSGFDYCSRNLPEGMKLVAKLGGGLLEWGMWMVGAEDYCLMVYDDPDLVRDITRRINDQQVAVADNAASHPDVIACALGDDLGFKTQTFLPPDALREFIFPGLRRIADAVHRHGKKFILHSCGNLTEIMDDLIEHVRIDAKHSFEDVIMPLPEAQRRWGDRVALLGGVDMDVLCRSDEAALRRYVRALVDTCAPKGGFAAGSGNSIANYVPPANLRAMLDEALA